MNTNLRGIKIFDDKEVPHGTLIQISVGTAPGHARVLLRLPGRDKWTDLGDIPIIDEVLSLPIKSVFLCHASEDEQAVTQIRERLFDDGHLPWFAPEDLVGGDAWKERIDAALEQANHVVVCLSNASIGKAGYFQREVRYAFEQRDLRPNGARYIVSLLLEPCTPPREFRDIHWIEYWKEDGHERLTKALRLTAES